MSIGPDVVRSFRGSFLLAGLLLAATVLAPLWSIDIPPLVDYPNHLARQFILAGLPDSEGLRAFYRADWHATPYLAMDGVVQALARVTSVEAAGWAFIALTLFLLAFAPFALNLALFGRVTPAAMLGLLFVHNTTVSLGFVPFLFSLGFALCLLALWIRSRDGPRWIRMALFPVLGSLLFFSHLVGFVIYGLTVTAYELGRHFEEVLARHPRAPLSLSSAQRTSLVSLALQCVVPLAVFVVFGPTSEADDALRETTYGGFGRKLGILAGMPSYLMPPYNWTLDRALAFALPMVLLLLLVFKKLQYPRRMLWPLSAVVLLFFAMPVQWLGGWGGDHRLLPAIGLLLAGGLRPAPAAWKGWALVLPLLVALVAIRVGAITVEWRRADHETAEYLRSFEVLSNGSRVYYAFGHQAGRRSWLRPKYFLPCLAVSKRQVYVPYLFTGDVIPGVPLKYRPEVLPLQRLSPGPILTDRASPDWEAIVDKYDYFILGDEKFFDQPVPGRLLPVFTGTGFRVYRNPVRGVDKGA